MMSFVGIPQLGIVRPNAVRNLVVFLSVAVSTEGLALCYLRAEFRLRVAVCHHLTDSHLLLGVSAMVIVETGLVVFATADTALAPSLLFVHPRTMSGTPVQRPFRFHPRFR